LEAQPEIVLMKNRCALIILLLSCLAAASLAQDPDKKPPDRDMIGTSLARNLCKTAPDENDEETRICKGVEGYSLLLKGDENKPQISLRTPDGTKHPIHYWDLSDPAFRGIEENVLWIVNTPDKTLAINFRLKIEPKEGQWGRYDVIARISPLPVCIVGSVPVSLKTGGQSMAIAVAPAARPCLALDELQKKN
jgi:hypothetical protein